MQFARLEHVMTESDPAGASLLSFRPTRPFRFRAGQFGLWVVGGIVRPFSIASAPDDEFVQLATRLHEGSGIKQALGRLTPGSRVRLLGPGGAIAPADDAGSIVYVAQGIGISVARSMIRAEPERPQTLIHIGAPYFRGDLEPRVTRAHYPQDRAAFDDALAATVAASYDAHFVVAGSSAFTKAVSHTLAAAGVAKHRISADGFIGLPNAAPPEPTAARPPDHEPSITA